MSVERPDDLSALKVVVCADEVDVVRLGAVLATVGSSLDGDDALLGIDALKTLCGAAIEDPSWLAGFDEMVAYAASNGWVGPGQTLRAHCEWR